MAKRAKVLSNGRNANVKFVMLPHYLTNSVAWQSLSGNAVKLLIEVWRRHNGANNGEITFAVREAEPIGIGRNAASKAFVELIDRGFLKVRRESGFTVKTRDARLWELTGEACDGRGASKEFMGWRPKAANGLRQVSRPKSSARPHGI